MHCDLRVRWKVARDLRFRAAISEPKTPSCCGISGDLAPSTRKSIAIAIVRFWCAKSKSALKKGHRGRPRKIGGKVGQKFKILCLRERQRGVENSREGKTYHKTHLQKRFWAPPPMIRFSPAFVHAMSFP